MPRLIQKDFQEVSSFLFGGGDVRLNIRMAERKEDRKGGNKELRKSEREQ